MTQWIKAKKTKIIKENNGNLDKIIDKSKSFEEQIELLKKLEDLNEYWYYKDFNDKELKSKYFKIKLADMSNKIDEKFEEILNFNKNENENENDETLMAWDKDDDKTMSQNKIKKLNDNLDEIIDKSKSFEEQIESLKKLEDLKGYWPYNDYDDKELKSKYFKIQLADMSNEIDKKLFEQIFGHTLIKLADKLINTTDKEENQIIVKNIKKK